MFALSTLWTRPFDAGRSFALAIGAVDFFRRGCGGVFSMRLITASRRRAASSSL
jgi:hypothetical protein